MGRDRLDAGKLLRKLSDLFHEWAGNAKDAAQKKDSALDVGIGEGLLIARDATEKLADRVDEEQEDDENGLCQSL